MKRSLIAAALVLLSAGQLSGQQELIRLKQRAQRVTITRDDWGIPHIHGKTDADAVFGLVYAQAEDDFNRVETNFINGMGRLAEAEGESQVFKDLRMKLFIHPDSLKKMYRVSPAWLKSLMNAWADGLNFYLATHPDVKPRVITKFEPWMALSFSEGSIGGDIEQIEIPDLSQFYGNPGSRPAPIADEPKPAEPGGSNGIAIAPSNTVNKHALFLINPHTSFFFRAEVQVSSDEGLNAYGAVTWGQFFVYQGFNQHNGWMHTSSNVDNIDEYAETIVSKGDRLYYRYGETLRPVTTFTVTVPYRTAAGMATREFAAYRTHHGPVVRSADGKWIAVHLMESPLKALQQSWLRTKTTGLASFRQVMNLQTNSSNNTIFADSKGNIAYFHANFIPRRDDRFDFSKPVDGSNPATDWGPIFTVAQSPLSINPKSGWVYNTNNAPWTASGPDSPRKRDFPRYVDGFEDQNPRGVHAVQLLSGRKDFTLESLIAAAYDSYQPAFADLIPVLVRDYDALGSSDPLKQSLADPIAMLRSWDYRWSASSIPTSIAMYWGDELWTRTKAADSESLDMYEAMKTKVAPSVRIAALDAAVRRLTNDFGTWRTPWGEINRFQRLTADIVQPFNDAGASIPVPFTYSRWGSLASFSAKQYPGTKKWYGTSGNSFVAAVEFGPRIRALAVTAGGESGHVGNPHFNDQATRYAGGSLREVYFYPEQLKGHTERVYHPGS